jgi:hypothetical protein
MKQFNETSRLLDRIARVCNWIIALGVIGAIIRFLV